VQRLATICGLLLACCSGGGGPPRPGADLSGFPVERIFVGGVPYEVWVADTPARQIQGLMFATPEQLLPADDGTERGMLFVYPAERTLAFWMRDTFVPLDLAYATEDGTIVEIHELEPHDETPVVSGQAVRFALELNAGCLAGKGVGRGAGIERP
jgi:uncharacterized membrane protein (UPF0127 family)